MREERWGKGAEGRGGSDRESVRECVKYRENTCVRERHTQRDTLRCYAFMLVIDRKYHVTLSERSAVLSVSSMSYSESVVTHTEYEYKNKNEYDK